MGAQNSTDSSVHQHRTTVTSTSSLLGPLPSWLLLYVVREYVVRGYAVRVKMSEKDSCMTKAWEHSGLSAAVHVHICDHDSAQRRWNCWEWHGFCFNGIAIQAELHLGKMASVVLPREYVSDKFVLKGYNACSVVWRWRYEQTYDWLDVGT